MDVAIIIFVVGFAIIGVVFTAIIMIEKIKCIVNYYREIDVMFFWLKKQKYSIEKLEHFHMGEMTLNDMSRQITRAHKRIDELEKKQVQP